MSTIRLSRFMLACAGVLALWSVVAAAASAGPAPQTAPGDAFDPRTYAPDSKLFLVAHATGVQKYTCQANGAWLFTDPEAVLDKTNGAPKPIGAHFLNFTTGRPVWRLKDGSSVEAARKASAPGAAGGGPRAPPPAPRPTPRGGGGGARGPLRRPAATPAGDDGARLAATRWVQRLNSEGGAAPAGPCAPGATAAVPYTADYSFWRASDD